MTTCARGTCPSTGCPCGDDVRAEMGAEAGSGRAGGDVGARVGNYAAVIPTGRQIGSNEGEHL